MTQMMKYKIPTIKTIQAKMPIHPKLTFKRYWRDTTTKLASQMIPASGKAILFPPKCASATTILALMLKYLLSSIFYLMFQ